MKKTALFLLLGLALNTWAQQPNSKQRMTFKSMVIQNGDTLITEKNIESDDPNARLSDSIFSQNGMFKFDFGGRDTDSFFQNFSDSFSSPMFDFDHFFQADSLFNKMFLNDYILDTNLMNPNPFFLNLPNPNNLKMSSQSPNRSLEVANIESTIDIRVLHDVKKMNIMFNLSNSNISLLSVENEQSKTMYSEQIEPAQGYYVRQIDFSEFSKGVYVIKLVQGTSIITKSIILD